MIRFISIIGVFCVLLLGTGAAVAATGPRSMPIAPRQQQSSQDVCFARWVWNTTDPDFAFWEAPFQDSLTGLLDLRSLPQMSRAGGVAEGWGLFAYNQPMGSTGMHCIGGNLDASITAAQANTLALMLGKNIGDFRSRNTRDLLKEIFIEEADPTGQTFWKPVRVSRQDGLKVFLGGYGAVIEEPFSESSPAFQATLDVRMVDYRRNAAEGMPQAVLERWTGYDMLKLLGRIDRSRLAEFVPPEYLAAGHDVRQPKTTITESWPTNGTTISTGQDLTWAEIDGDFTVVAGVLELADANTKPVNGARAESDLSSDDHYAQVVMTKNDAASNSRAIAATRFAAAANTHYKAFLNGNGAIFLYRVVTGTATAILTSATYTLSVPHTLYISADSSTLIVNVDSVEKYNTTDTTITGNVRAGVGINDASTVGDVGIDSFEAADLAVAADEPTQQIIIVRAR